MNKVEATAGVAREAQKGRTRQIMNQEQYTEIRRWVIKGGYALLSALAVAAVVAFLNVFGLLGLVVIVAFIIFVILWSRRGK